MIALNLTIPRIGSRWPDCDGTFAGLIHTIDGVHALVLLDAKPDGRKAWKDALKWASTLDADLPSRVESLVLFKHLRKAFEPSWHWTCEPEGSSHAWRCNFSTAARATTSRASPAAPWPSADSTLNPSILPKEQQHDFHHPGTNAG